MMDNIFSGIKSIIQFIEEKRGYGYNGWKETTTMGLTTKFKEYEEKIPGFIDKFYGKPRFGSDSELHRWVDRHGNFIEYRSKRPMND